jgi:RHS repeat-associated protein
MIAANEGTVEPHSGNLYLSSVDLQMSAGAIQLEVRRDYKNQSPSAAGWLGSCWRLNWECHFSTIGPLAIIEDSYGPRTFALDQASGTYRSASGDVISVLPDGAVHKKPDGTADTFDAQGQLVARDLRNGNVIRLRYDDHGHIAEINGPCKAALQFTTSEAGRLVKIRSSDGASVGYAYNGEPNQDSAHRCVVSYDYAPSGLLASVSHPQTGAINWKYDSQNRVTSKVFPDGTSERYEYDADRRTARYYAANGAATTFSRSADDLVTTTIDPLGNKIVVERNAAGQTSKVVGPTGQVAQMQYDARGRVTTIESSATGRTELTYLGDSPLVASLKSSGEEQQFHYDSQLNLKSVHSHDCDSTTLEYYPNGQIKTSGSCGGGVREYAYDENGRLTAITDADGQSWKYEYDARGRLVREVNSKGGTTSRTYDPQGRLASTTDPLGATTKYAYAPNGRLAKRLGPSGETTEYQYDARGRLASITDPDQGTTKYEYGGDNRLKSRVDGVGRTFRYEYDALGNLLRETDPLGGLHTHTRDPLGRVTELSTADGGTWSWEFSPAGYVAKSREPSGQATQYHYDSNGHLTEQIDGAGVATQFTYTAEGRIETITAKDRPELSYAYDAAGRLLSSTCGKQTVHYQYDAVGRRIRATHPNGREVQYTYDSLANMTGWKDNRGASEAIEYDAGNRPVSIRDSAQGTSRYQYDLSGNLVALTGPLGNSQHRSFSPAGKLREVSDETIGRAVYDYDAAGRLTKLTRPSGGQTRYAYDVLGNPTTVTDPLGNETKATYDEVGRVKTKTDAKGQTTEFTYDPAGRLRQKRFSDGATVRYEYDAQSRVTSVDDGAFPVHYAYDTLGNCVQMEYPAIKRVIRAEYNIFGQRTKLVDSEGRTTHYEYDGLQRLAALKLGEKDAIAFGYDESGRLATVKYPDGAVRSCKYDVAGRATSLAITGRDGKTLADWKFGYDAAGNRTEIAQPDGTRRQYRFDAAGQLTEESNGDQAKTVYSYAKGGNRAKLVRAESTTEYKVDADDRLVAAGGETFTWDASGNLTERKDTKGTTRYGYNGANQLVGVTLPDGTEVHYGYAPTGQRVWRSVAGRKTYFVYDGLDLIAELDSDLQTQAAYVHGPNIDQPLVIDAGKQRVFCHADVLGSIVRLTDTTGKSVATWDYDPFGNSRETTETPSPCPFRFSAREFDAETGLYYFRARYYDAKLGRFLSRDPARARLVQPMQLNPYLYARNNPLQVVDPLGTDDFWQGYGGFDNVLDTPEVFAQKLKIVQDNIARLKDIDTTPKNDPGRILALGKAGAARVENMLKAQIDAHLQEQLLKYRAEEARLNRILGNEPSPVEPNPQQVVRAGGEAATPDTPTDAGNGVRTGGEVVTPDTPSVDPTPAGAGTPKGDTLAVRPGGAADGNTLAVRPGGAPEGNTFVDAPNAGILDAPGGFLSGDVDPNLVSTAGGIAVGGGLIGANYYACLHEQHSQMYCAAWAGIGAGFSFGAGLLPKALVAITEKTAYAAAGAAGATLAAGAGVGLTIVGAVKTGERLGNLPAVEAAAARDQAQKDNLAYLEIVLAALKVKIDDIANARGEINKKQNVDPDQVSATTDAATEANNSLSVLQGLVDQVSDAAKGCKQAQAALEAANNHSATAVSSEKTLESELDEADAKAKQGAPGGADIANLKAKYEENKARLVTISQDAAETTRQNEKLKPILEQARAARSCLTQGEQLVTAIQSALDTATKTQETVRAGLSKGGGELDGLQDKISALQVEISRDRPIFPNGKEIDDRFGELSDRLHDVGKLRPAGDVAMLAGRIDEAVNQLRRALGRAQGMNDKMKANEICDETGSADQAVTDALAAKAAATQRLSASADLAALVGSTTPTGNPNDPNATKAVTVPAVEGRLASEAMGMFSEDFNVILHVDGKVPPGSEDKLRVYHQNPPGNSTQFKTGIEPVMVTLALSIDGKDPFLANNDGQPTDPTTQPPTDNQPPPPPPPPDEPPLPDGARYRYTEGAHIILIDWKQTSQDAADMTLTLVTPDKENAVKWGLDKPVTVTGVKDANGVFQFDVKEMVAKLLNNTELILALAFLNPELMGLLDPTEKEMPTCSAEVKSATAGVRPPAATVGLDFDIQLTVTINGASKSTNVKHTVTGQRDAPK